MKLLKLIFIVSSNDTRYEKTAYTYLLVSFIGYLLDYLLYTFVENEWVSCIGNYLWVFLWLYITGIFIGNMAKIESNIVYNARKQKRYSFNHDPISIAVEDLSLLINKHNEPEAFWFKDSFDNNHVVDISYDIKRKSILYNRKLYLDNLEIEEDKLIERLNEFSSDGMLNVYESAEGYSPKIILQEIEDLKKS